MTPGDPWDTEQRELLRAHQRRVLALLPDWTIPDIRGPLEAAPHPVRERAVRERIEAELIPDSAGARYLERLHAETLTAALFDALQPGKGDLRRLATVAHQAMNGAVMQDVSEEAARWIRELVQLLVLADRLADDGYFDPRLL